MRRARSPGLLRGLATAETVTVLAVAAYATTLLVTSDAYSLEARLFPIAVTVLALVVCTAYIAVLLRRARPASSDEPAEGDVAEPPESSSAAAQAEPDRQGGRPARQLAMVLVPALTLFFLAGIYAFALVLPAAFMRRLGGHSWVSSMAVGIGLVAFSWVVLNLLVDFPVPEWGLIGMWVAS